MRFRVASFVPTMLYAPVAFAQTAAVPDQPINLTALAVAVVGGIFSVIGTVLTVQINARMKDKQAAEVLNNAVKNSLGAMQQATVTTIEAAQPTVTVPGVSGTMAVGVQYVANHAGDEAARLGITPAAIADKINAQIGLTKIAAAAPGPVLGVKA